MRTGIRDASHYRIFYQALSKPDSSVTITLSNNLHMELIMNPDFIVVLITVPSTEVGEQIASALVEQKLAACVNILPSITSIYAWQGEVQNDRESLLVVKTRAELFHERLVPAINARHPYDVPELIALPVVMGSKSYLDWIAAETEPVA
jgi:periplasmic divalent cation tolerance protein